MNYSYLDELNFTVERIDATFHNVEVRLSPV